MDCLAFRRALLASPHSASDDLLAHAQQCPKCKAYRRGIQRSEQFLHQAVKLPVPECLPARVLVRQSSSSRRVGSWRYSSLLAACLVVAIALGLRFDSSNSPVRWQRAVQHYMSEANTPSALSGLVAITEVNSLLGNIGVRLDEKVGAIASAKPCVIGDRQGAHLIVAGDAGPVSILVMPDAALQDAVSLETANMSGVIAPCPRGSIAFLGEAGESIAKIRKRFESAVNFI